MLLKHVYPHVVARLGDDVRLSCPVAGTPPPMLEWRKDGAQIRDAWERFSVDGDTLHVARVTADDAGVYVCDAVNGFGTKRVTTELFVIDPETSGLHEQFAVGQGPADNLVNSRGRPPVILIPKKGENRLVRPLLSRLAMKCMASGFPEPDVKWYKNGRVVLPSTRVQVTTKAGQGELVLTKLTNSDQGVFICVAANFFGSANHSFSLQTTDWVSPDPVFLTAPANTTVYEGETAVLQCHVQSASKAHIKWVRRVLPGSSAAFNQTAVEIQGSRYVVMSGALTVQDGDSYFTKLTLPAAAPTQQGVYVCMAANDRGFAGREAFLQVAPAAPPNSMQALLIALPAVAVVGFILGAICCLHRRRKTLPPPGEDKTKQQVRPLPPGVARPQYVTQRYAGEREQALKTVLMPPPGRSCADGGSSGLSSSASRTYGEKSYGVPPPAPYDYRQFRHLDVV